MVNTNIGKYIQRERIRKGLTQEQLAELTGISWSAISRFETGKTMLSVERILKITDALEIGVEVVFQDYIKALPDSNDEITKEILVYLGSCSVKEKRYVLEHIKLMLEYMHEE